MQARFDLSRLLKPRSIAVMGGQAALNVLNQCQLMGFEGDLWPVHPSREVMAGLKVYRSIADLPAAPDVCFVGVNRQLTPTIVAELAAKGAGGAVCYASGFREADEEGKQLEAALQAAATQLPILGPIAMALLIISMAFCFGQISKVASAWLRIKQGSRFLPSLRILPLISPCKNGVCQLPIC